LVLLLLIPLTIWWSFHSLAGLGTVRRWIALTLRCSLILFLSLALAEVYLLHTNDTLTVLFVLDRSESIPVQKDPSDDKRDLALACFPEGTGKRIVLISDGNENLGKAEEQARIAKQNNVEIDTVFINSGDRSQNEVIMERIEAPSLTDTDTRMPIRIVVRSFF